MKLALMLIFICFSGLSSANRIERLVMPGELIKGHAKYENQCEKCHQPFTKIKQNELCRDCHEKVDKDLKENIGFHGKSKINNRPCKGCHTDHEGRNANIVLFEKGLLDHDKTDFKLTGGHQKTDCNNCHKEKKKYREADHECYGCHEKDDVHKKELGEKCDDCHDSQGWRKNSFDHDETEFKLIEKHADVSCAGCHPSENYKEIQKECVSCHELNDVHEQRFGDDCKECHSEQGWDKSKFKHNEDTEFIIKGGHKNLSCESCHRKNEKKRKTPRKCIACHRSDDEHSNKFGEKCQECHTESDWKKKKYDHDKETEFPLFGKHKEIKCNACHKSDLYEEELDSKCPACHKWDDVHQKGQGEQCDVCHNEKGWLKGVQFDHDMTGFPLLGIHAAVLCEECHLTKVYQKTESECQNCHKDDDTHKKKLGGNCKLCHNPNSWKVWKFDHNIETDYKLDGKHEGLDCHSCHKSPLKEEMELPVLCIECHQTDDIHSGMYGRMCEECHNTESFQEIKLK